MKYAVIYKNRGNYAVMDMCRFFEVSRSGYYAYLKRMNKPDRDEELAQMIQERRNQRYGKSLGCRRMQKWLERFKGIHRNYKTVWRIMRKYGLLSECRRRRFYRPGETLHVYANHLNREFYSSHPDTKWVTDITYVQTPQGTLYVSAILDLYDRRVVACQTSARNDNKLVLDTIKLAMKKRKVTEERYLHSDQGFQYTSPAYFSLTKSYGITPSMSRRANPYDNAVAENFFGMLKTECLYPCKPQSISQAVSLVRDYILFFNSERQLLK